MPQVKITKVSSAKAHTGAVYALLRDTGALDSFYSAGGDGNVIRWSLDDLTTAVKAAHVPASIFSMILLPAQNRLAIGQMHGGIHVLDLKDKKEIKHLAYHLRGVFDLQYDDGSKRMVAGGGDGVLSIWDDEFSLQNTVQLSLKSIRSLAFSPSKHLLAAGCSDNSVYILNCADWNILHQLREHQNSVFAVYFSPDGKYLLTGSRDAHLRIWDAAGDFRLIKAIPAHLFTINSIACNQNGKIFATASRDKTIKIWSAENFELLKVIDKEKFDGHANSVNKLIWMSDNTLASCSDDRSIMIWNIELHSDL